MKFCEQCGFDRPREDFLYGGQLRRLCAEHYQAHHAAQYRKSIEARKATNRQYNKDNAVRLRQAAKDRLAKYKKLVFEHYSNGQPKCDCCGESHFEFLALDHKHGGGTKHRAEVTGGGGLRTYVWAVKNNYPPIFRILCHNCNSSHGYFGYCPHDIERNQSK